MQPAALMARVVPILLAVASVQPACAQLQDAGHVIRRTSFGTNHNTLNALSTGGPPAIAAYIQDQLNLNGTEDPRVPALLSGIVPAASIAQLQQQQVVRAAFVMKRSFTPYGIPCSGLRYLPAANSVSACAARASACSFVSMMTERTFGSSRSIRLI